MIYFIFLLKYKFSVAWKSWNEEVLSFIFKQIFLLASENDDVYDVGRAILQNDVRVPMERDASFKMAVVVSAVY